MDLWIIILFIFLFFLSAFFSGTEIALMSMPNHKIEWILRSGKFWSKSLKYIKDRNEKLLITILIWNNLVNVYTASLATQISIQIAENSGLEQSLAIWISTWIVTFLLLLFWEIAPKTFATRNAASISLLVAKPYRILMFILYPVVIVIESLIKIFTWKNSKDAELTDEEIEAFIDMWKDSWTLEASEHEKLKNILEFANIQAEEIMTPRVKIEALEINSTVQESIDFALSHTHTRLPVYKDTIDNIEFIISLRDLLLNKENWNTDKKLIEIESDKAMKVPLNMPIDDLFEKFKKSRKHIAILMDEYGWVAGLVTLEDVIEEVFWEIRDEVDKEIDEVKKLHESKYIYQSNVSFEDILSNFWLDLKKVFLEEKEYHWVNLSYFITNKLERFPKTDEIISLNIKTDEDSDLCSNINFKVLDVVDAKIWEVEVEVVDKKLEN